MDKELQTKLASMLKMNKNNGISYLTSAECAYRLITQENKAAVIEAVNKIEVEYWENSVDGVINSALVKSAITTALDTEVK